MIAARLVSNILPFTIPEEKKENKDFMEVASRKENTSEKRGTRKTCISAHYLKDSKFKF